MPTQKLYLELDDLTGQAVITALIDGERRIVRLDRTLFHAQGGGQRADRGTIAGKAVLDVRHAEDGEVDHVVETLDGLSVSDKVSIAIDEGVRRLHARLHTAGHLIGEAGSIVAPGLAGKAGHHWPREARVEFEGPAGKLDDFKSRLQEQIDAMIAADVAVERVGDPHSSRAISIGGGAPVGCGGTHLRSCAALESVTVRKVQEKKGIVRVSYGVSGED